MQQTTITKKLVNTELLDQLAKKFNCVSRSTRVYKTKAWTNVILFEYYQQSNSDRECVARYFDYGYGRVFKDLLHNISYTDCEAFMKS